MEFKEVVKERFSCKKFGPKQVGNDVIKAILEAGRLAPTAKNLQEQHVYVLQSAESLAAVDKHTPCRSFDRHHQSESLDRFHSHLGGACID